MNKVQLIGRLTDNLELRYTQNKKSVVSFSLAVPKREKNNGADFISCVAWGNTAENMSKYLKQGSRIAVCGRLSVRKYTKDNKVHSVTEVIAEEVEFLESKKTENTEFTPVDDSDLPF